MSRRVLTLAFAGLAALASLPAGAQTASAPAAAASPAKKELVARVLKAQQGEIETVARSIVEQPAAQMMREAGMHIQTAVPQDKRDAMAKGIEAEVKKYVDESYPIMRDRAIKIAPTTIGSVLEAKMSEDELKQLATWLESPANKKYQQVSTEWRTTFVQQLLGEAGPLIRPKLIALDGRVRTVLGLPPAPTPGAAPGAAPASSRPAGK